MATFKVEIETDNADFDGRRVPEIRRILHDVCDRLSELEPGDRLKLRDVNGNRVGFAELTTEED